MKILRSIQLAASLLSVMAIPAVAGDLTDGLRDGSIWEKDRPTICSSDFVGLRYRPVDNHSICLMPRLSITSCEVCPRKVKKIDLKDSKLGMGNLKFGETIVYWDDENKTKRIDAWIYTRSDDGDREKGEFNTIIKDSFRQLTAITKGLPELRADVSEADIDHVGVDGMRQWYWEWDGGVILMEASSSDTADDGSPFKAEFIRLKIGRDRDAIATGGADNISKKKDIKKNVKDDPRSRDRWIAGIPMIDQGTKGYCVPATTARVFAYYGMDAVDMHTMAQMFDSHGREGTSLCKMVQGLSEISEKFKYELRCPIAITGARSARNDWYKEVRSHIDDGIPLLWCVELGIADEAGIPKGYEGSHMRLIIGYNKRTRSIIFTDSWGEGHEFKYLKLDDAYKITSDMRVIVPKK
ncbi:MAG: C39 family peptidase [Akkermansia sp.]|nr:C39 family peptidase [Akkermansia sp.]